MTEKTKQNKTKIKQQHCSSKINALNKTNFNMKQAVLTWKMLMNVSLKYLKN